MLLDRNLFKISYFGRSYRSIFSWKIQIDLLSNPSIQESDLPYLIIQGNTSNAAYVSGKQNINILTKDKRVLDIAEASDLPTIKALSNIVKNIIYVGQRMYICGKIC